MKKGDLVRLRKSIDDRLFVVYSVFDECVKLCDCVTNVFYPAGDNLYIKKHFILPVKERE